MSSPEFNPGRREFFKQEFGLGEQTEAQSLANGLEVIRLDEVEVIRVHQEVFLGFLPREGKPTEVDPAKVLFGHIRPGQQVRELGELTRVKEGGTIFIIPTQGKTPAEVWPLLAGVIGQIRSTRRGFLRAAAVIGVMGFVLSGCRSFDPGEEVMTRGKPLTPCYPTILGADGESCLKKRELARANEGFLIEIPPGTILVVASDHEVHGANEMCGKVRVEVIDPDGSKEICWIPEGYVAKVVEVDPDELPDK